MLRKAIQQKHGRFLKTIPKLVVGVSGGADSLALLHVLKEIMGAKRLVVAHLDHGWRTSSKADAAFVRQTAVSWGIPYHGKRLESSQKQSGLEATGRAERYRFFADVARCEKATHIAVGHHQDDQVETILLHLLRGSGLKGLQGMHFESLLAENEAVVVIRPLLHTSRSEIESYCQMHQLSPREDETNSDPQFLRNRLRHELLPDLRTYNAQIDGHLLQLAEITSEDESLMFALAEEAWSQLNVEQGEGWLTLPLDAWRTTPIALQRRLLRTAVSTLNPSVTDIGFRSIEEARLGVNNGRFGQTFHLPSGITLTIQANSLLCLKPDTDYPYDLPLIDEEHLKSIQIPGTMVLENDWVLEATIIEAPDFEVLFENELIWDVYLPIVDELIMLRTRRAGDRIRPFGMNGRSRKLKKLMSENHIPRSLRDKWPIISIGEEIIWVPSVGRSNAFVVQGNESKLIHLRIIKNEPQ